MSEKKDDVDPQYLYILPKYFALNYDNFGPALLRGEISEDTPYLACMVSRSSNKRVVPTFSEEGGGVKISGHKFAEDDIRPSSCMEALHNVGLDFKGDFVHFRRTIEKAWIEYSPLPTSNIIVKDVETASKFVNLGLMLESATPPNPTTLKEAAKYYTLVCDLVDDPKGNDPTMTELEKKIEESNDENEIWGLEREKFRMKIKGWCEDKLFDMALSR